MLRFAYRTAFIAVESLVMILPLTTRVGAAMQSRAARSGRASAVTVRRAVCIAVAAAAILSAGASSATAAHPTKGAEYAHQSERTEVIFRVSRNGKRLKEIFLALTMRCSNGREGVALFLGIEQDPLPKVRIARDGSFAGMFTVDEDWLDPFAVSDEYWLSGRFIRRGKAARLVVRSRQVGEGGTVCDTGDRHAKARRRTPV
jgi:hypothetical protein